MKVIQKPNYIQLLGATSKFSGVTMLTKNQSYNGLGASIELNKYLFLQYLCESTFFKFVKRLMQLFFMSNGWANKKLFA